ncbi:MAG TPA: hypothetical protein VE956_04960 [Nodularia sp. (in: cyanobacteria)]|nr:hypothetical protein [Nodularia sp. (in: cyanobacteria)]
MDFSSGIDKSHGRNSDSLTFTEPAIGRLLFPGAVVDADEVYLFHQTIEQDIAKLSGDSKRVPCEFPSVAKRSLESGKLLWIVKTPGVPLAVTDQKLWLIEGRETQFRILALHTKTGKTIHTSDWFEMLLGFPAMFNYQSGLGLSFRVEARWATLTKHLWIRVDGNRWYEGGLNIGEEMEAASRHTISLLVKVIPATGEISLAKTNYMQGEIILGNKLLEPSQVELPIPLLEPHKEVAIPFPSGCVEEAQVNSSLIPSSGYDVPRLVKLSHYVVSLEASHIEQFPWQVLLLLQVHSPDQKQVVWQQYMGDYHQEPAHC